MLAYGWHPSFTFYEFNATGLCENGRTFQPWYRKAECGGVHHITSWNYFWSLPVLLFFLYQSSTPTTSPTPPPPQGWNIEAHLLAKSPSAAVIPMTLDGQINMSGSLSNSGNNVGLIFDDKRICSIENQWEVASAACYCLCFPSEL